MPDQPVSLLLMRRDLGAPIPAPSWPPGIRLSPFAPGHAVELHDLLTVAYARGGGTVGSFASRWGALAGDAEFDPALCFVARDDEGRAVGVAQCWTSAFVKDLVVHPRWRRRGLGAALLLHVFVTFKARGATSVDLKMRENNPSGALRLYRRVGMDVLRRV